MASFTDADIAALATEYENLRTSSRALNEAEKEMTKTDLSDQMKYLVDQKIEVLKSIN